MGAGNRPRRAIAMTCNQGRSSLTLWKEFHVAGGNEVVTGLASKIRPVPHGASYVVIRDSVK